MGPESMNRVHLNDYPTFKDNHRYMNGAQYSSSENFSGKMNKVPFDKLLENNKALLHKCEIQDKQI